MDSTHITHHQPHDIMTRTHDYGVQLTLSHEMGLCRMSWGQRQNELAQQSHGEGYDHYYYYLASLIMSSCFYTTVPTNNENRETQNPCDIAENIILVNITCALSVAYHRTYSTLVSGNSNKDLLCTWLIPLRNSPMREKHYQCKARNIPSYFCILHWCSIAKYTDNMDNFLP